MLQQNTVFIIGAGVSAELGLPLGKALLGKIANRLPTWQNEGDPQVEGALQRWSVGETYQDAAKRVMDAIPFAASIDNLIEHMNGDETAVFAAKLGIVSSILADEGRSPLRPGPGGVRDVSDTSFRQIFELIVGNVHRSRIEVAFERVAFINFNYDRCLEQFLRRALMAYSGMDADAAAALVRNITIKHPYGWLGEPDWMGKGGCEFGASYNHRVLKDAAARILTFSEEVDSMHNAEIREIVSEARQLIFLGCAPHPQNMRLIQPPYFHARDVYGTVYAPPPADPSGLAAPDMATFIRPIADAMAYTVMTWPRPPRLTNLARERVRFDPLTCRQLIARYGASWTE